MPHFHALVSNCEEYRAAYTAAYPVYYTSAWALALDAVPQTVAHERMQAYRLKVEAEGEAAKLLPDAGPAGLQVAGRALADAREHALADAYADCEGDRDGALRRSLRLRCYITATLEGATRA